MKIPHLSEYIQSVATGQEDLEKQFGHAQLFFAYKCEQPITRTPPALPDLIHAQPYPLVPETISLLH